LPGPGGHGEYQKFRLSGDVTPRNLGLFGVKDLEANASPPSTPPPPTLHPGHCDGLWVAWAPNPPQDEVARYELRYGTDPQALTGPRYAVESSYFLDGLQDDVKYYVTVEAVDDSGNISPPSQASSETTANDNKPEWPQELTATEDLEGRVELAWSIVTENQGPPPVPPAADPLSPGLRDLQGYLIYRSTNAGFEVGEDDPPLAESLAAGFADVEIVNCRDYWYRIKAVDQCGEKSEQATPAVRGESIYTIKPRAPLNVQAFWEDQGGFGTIRLEWDAVTQDVEGNPIHIEDYWVHRAEVPAGSTPADVDFSPYEHLSGVTEWEEPVPPLEGPDADVFYYRLTAHDDCVNESDPSEAAAAICDFSGDVVILQPLPNASIDTDVWVAVQVTGGAASYLGSQLKVVRLSTGQTVLNQTDPTAGSSWSYLWPASNAPGGLYRIDASVVQDNDCVEATSVFVYKQY
jgi:hypothetical protein